MLKLNKDQFDADWQPFVNTFNQLVAAIEAYIASKQGQDLSAEDQQLKTMAAQAATELQNLANG